MCLIVVDANTDGVSEDLILAAHQNNPDGFGIMMPTGNGKIHVHKSLVNSGEECKNIYDKYLDGPIALHFRFNTHGDTSKAQCHPFQILNFNEHGRDVWIMHNGPHIDVPMMDDKKSDTWHFVEHILKPILIKNPDIIEESGFADFLKNVADTDRLTLLDGKTEKFLNINFSVTDKFDGLELSNTYSLRRDKGRNYNPSTGQTSYISSMPDYYSQGGHGTYGSLYNDSSMNPYVYDDNLGHVPYIPNDNKKDFSLPTLDKVLGDIREVIEAKEDPSDADWTVMGEIASAMDIYNETVDDKPIPNNKSVTICEDVVKTTNLSIDDLKLMSETELYNFVVMEPDQSCEFLLELM